MYPVFIKFYNSNSLSWKY